MPDPFITEQDLVDYLGRGSTSDPGMLIAVDAACDICRDIAGGQEFNAGTSTITVDGTGTDAILLPQFPVTSAGTVTVNGGTVTDYVLSDNAILLRKTPVTAGSSSYYSDCVPPIVWPSGRQNVGVTYVHGYTDDTFPRSVRMVALAIASRLVVQGPALEETVGSVRVKYAAAATDLTNGEKAILRRYARPR